MCTITFLSTTNHIRFVLSLSMLQLAECERYSTLNIQIFLLLPNQVWQLNCLESLHEPGYPLELPCSGLRLKKRTVSTLWVGIVQSAERLATSWTVQGLNRGGGGEIFCTGSGAIIKFTSSNRQTECFQIPHINRLLTGVNNTKFLGLELDTNINWKNHIHKTLPKLSSASYLIRRMYPSFNINTLKMIYFAYFHSVMEFGILFWGVSVESKKVFLQQKRVIRIMTGSPPRSTCRTLFCKLEILTMISQYILSSMRFLSSNLGIFTFNSSVHSINTRSRLKLHKPLVRLKLYQQSPYYNCVNIYNKLPDDLAKLITNKKQFLQQLKNYLIDKPFYTMEEFFEY